VSKALGPKTQGLSTYEKEYMAIILALEHWRAYLQCSEFIIYTDQKSLAQLPTQRLHTAWQQKVLTKLLGFNYTVVYKKGADNTDADALSRHPAPPAQILAISTSVSQWLTSVTDAYAVNDQAQQLLQQLAIANGPVGNFTLQQGVIRHKGRIWVTNNPAVQQQIFQAFNESALGVTLVFLLLMLESSNCSFGKT
jgi:hypothetical protein